MGFGIATRRLLRQSASSRGGWMSAMRIKKESEIVSALTAAFGAVLAAVGLFFLVSEAVAARRPWHVLAFSVYGVSVVNMFASSALHHGVNASPRINHFFHQLDYFAISVMIAGTFTPFCLILFRSTLGWSVLGLLWSLAVLAIAIKAIWPGVPKWITLSFYIGMGWTGIVIVVPIYHALSWHGLFPLILGGLFFTIGGIIFGLEKPDPVPGIFGFHELWHCFVLAGAATHFYGIYSCLAPLRGALTQAF